MRQCEEGMGLRLARLFSVWYGNPCSREFMVSGRILNTRAGAPCSLVKQQRHFGPLRKENRPPLSPIPIPRPTPL